MDFLKQKGPLAREFCNTLIYIISLVSLKPSEGVDRTSMEWDVVLFSGIFRCHFYGNAV